MLMTMGEYIKQLREERGWTMDELGKKVGVNRAAVQKWEKGTVENIKRSKIKELAKIFGVSPCELMCWEEDPGPKEAPEESSIHELLEKRYGSEALRVFSMFLKLDAPDKIVISGAMDALLRQEKYSAKK